LELVSDLIAAQLSHATLAEEAHDSRYDELGHPAGDLILRAVADAIRATRAVDEGFRVPGLGWVLIASGERQPDTLHAAADRELLAAKAALYGRKDSVAA
jgi:hypothetical protein